MPRLLMTDTQVTRRMLGASWPRHYNKVLAETLQTNIEQVGLPAWTEDDDRFARAVQRAAGGEPTGLRTQPAKITVNPFSPGTDDIGDVSWVVPTVQLRYPANLANLPGHHWANAMTMATPIAHKGVVAGAKVVAATVLDLLLRPELIAETKRYFEEQTADAEIRTVHRRGGKAADRPEPDVDGQVPSVDAAVLLRRQALRHVSGAIGRRLSDTGAAA